MTGAIAGWIQLMAKFVEACDYLLTKLGQVHTGWKELSDSLKLTADVMGNSAEGLFKQSSESFDKIGKGAEVVGKVIDDVQRGAAGRGGGRGRQVDRVQFAGAIGKKEEPKCGGALELGSKEAYSSLVRNVIGTSERGEQKQIAANTARAAAAARKHCCGRLPGKAAAAKSKR